jgi:hypothetical protein
MATEFDLDQTIEADQRASPSKPYARRRTPER